MGRRSGVQRNPRTSGPVRPRAVAAAARRRYDECLAGRISEEVICGEMVQIHAGIPESKIVTAAEQFFKIRIAGRIFPEMRELIAQLAKQGCEIWAVSSTNEWVVRAGAASLGIPGQRVLA